MLQAERLYMVHVGDRLEWKLGGEGIPDPVRRMEYGKAARECQPPPRNLFKAGAGDQSMRLPMRVQRTPVSHAKERVTSRSKE